MERLVESPVEQISTFAPPTTTSSCGWSRSSTLVAMVEPADLGQFDDLAHARRLDRPWLGRILAQREMRARLVIVRKVSFQNSMEMALAEDDHVVETFSTYGAHQAFGIRILPR